MLKMILTVPAIMVIAIGSVVLISKAGGANAMKRIRMIRGLDEIKTEARTETEGSEQEGK